MGDLEKIEARLTDIEAKLNEVDSRSSEIADKAVKKTFAILGVDIENPTSVEEFREDLRFGKRMRKAADKSFIGFWGLVATAAAVAMWAGIVQFIRGG